MTLPDIVYFSETKYQRADTTTQPPVQYFRQPHDIEMILGTPSADVTKTDRIYRGDGIHNGTARDRGVSAIPEVYRLLPDHQTPLECRWVNLWRNLNPELSLEVFCTLLDENFAWMNHGCGWPDRYNCLTGTAGTDPGNRFKPPAFDAPRICGGALLKGAEQNGRLYIQSMLSSDPTPPAHEVLSKPWLWYWGVEVGGRGQVTFITRARADGSGTRIPVRVPLITRQPVYLQLIWLDKLPPGFIPPSALWMP